VQRQIQLAFCLILLLALAGCGRGPGLAPTPTATATATPPATATLTAEGLSFAVDTAKSVFGYTGTGQGVLGFAKLTGTIGLSGTAVELMPEGEGYRVRINLQIDTMTATAINDLLLNTLRGVLEVDKHPYAYFYGQSDAVVALPDGQTAQVNLVGTLELRKFKLPLTVPIRITRNGDTLTGSTQLNVDLVDYKINVPTAIMNSKIVFDVSIWSDRTPTAP
jgi:polyisoprenoid-binding protein YceI